MNRNLIIGIVAVLLLLLVAGGVFFLSNRSEEPEEEVVAEEELPKIDSKELGLTIIPSSDKQYIQFKITNLKDIKHLEWEFTYDADAPDTGDGEGGRVTQGFGGEADIDSGEKEYVSDKRELGTCSTGGKCRFDTGIEKVDLILKITKKDGKVYQSEASQTI
jgi:hypothetical protein